MSRLLPIRIELAQRRLLLGDGRLQLLRLALRLD